MFAVVNLSEQRVLTKEAKEFLDDPSFSQAWEYIYERDNSWKLTASEIIISKHRTLENAVKHFRKYGDAIKNLKTGEYFGAEKFYQQQL